MFNEAQKQSYKEIKAPDELRERVFASAKAYEEKKSKFSPVLVKRLALAAACLICVFTVTAVALGNRSNVKFYSDGELITAEGVTDRGLPVAAQAFARSIPGVRVKVFVEVNKETELYVNGGFIEKEDASSENPSETLVLTKDASVLWTVANPFQDSYTLTAQSGSKAFTLVLEFDNETGSWRLYEEK